MPTDWRADNPGTLVRVYFSEGDLIVVELADFEHFNTFSAALGDDMLRAVDYLQALSVGSPVMLQGAGPHFSVGGNPYAQGVSSPSFASIAAHPTRLG